MECVGIYKLEETTVFNELNASGGWYRSIRCLPQQADVRLERNKRNVPRCLTVDLHGVVVSARSTTRFASLRKCPDIGSRYIHTTSMDIRYGISRRIELDPKYAWLAGDEDALTRAALSEMLSHYAERGKRLPTCYANTMNLKWVRSHVSRELWERVKPEMSKHAK